jgi:hypothetical protein
MTQFTVGCDPEFFVQNVKKEEGPNPYGVLMDSGVSLDAAEMKALFEKVKKKAPKEPRVDSAKDVVLIIGHLGGTKEHPKKVDIGLGDGYAVQEDGIAAEFNVPAFATAHEFGNGLSQMLAHMEQNILKPKGLVRSTINHLTLRKEWTDKFPKLKLIGCDPDFCAYDSKDGLPVSRALNPELIAGVRGAGGHVHIGYPVTLCDPHVIAKLCDIVLGLQFLGNDKQGSRRRWWGLAGLYRPKPYGVEYRTMSNWWIWKSSTAKMVAGTALALVESIPNHMIEWSAAFNAIDWDAVKLAIDTEDTNRAKELFDRYYKQFPIIEKVCSTGHSKATYTPPPVLIRERVNARPAPRVWPAVDMPQEFFIQRNPPPNAVEE